MVNTIKIAVGDILAADASLYAGGTAWATGWIGVKRQLSGDTPQGGYVNLFDRPWTPESSDYRPAVYLGARNNEGQERPNFEVCGQTFFRTFLLPLVTVVNDADVYVARAKRDQLQSNIVKILIKQANRIQAGKWYDMWLDSVVDKITSTGSANGIVEAEGVMNYMFRFSRTPSGVLA